MEWLYPKRRGPEWKHGWTEQTLASITTPPLPLLAIFAIVIFLLCLSQYTNYKAQIQHSMINFQLVLFLLPVLLIFVLLSGFTSGRFNIRALSSDQRSGGFPWPVAVLVVVLLVLVSYQSSFHSKRLGSV
ncbi:DNA polymerase subunit gamma-1 like [Actinidia chinensis var. chinensis]|uniref:DNA polymerase subunit gamma-1 like n=1 Tax=Actinidia chinensis var. chinensis TaxID=1590841 RepID=A0A2R6RHJ1_ACTCC|nr:DNA polymerase subunit gamma-1 like [Actinidia chinensis var. chinensis]